MKSNLTIRERKLLRLLEPAAGDPSAQVYMMQDGELRVNGVAVDGSFTQDDFNSLARLGYVQAQSSYTGGLRITIMASAARDVRDDFGLSARGEVLAAIYEMTEGDTDIAVPGEDLVSRTGLKPTRVDAGLTSLSQLGCIETDAPTFATPRKQHQKIWNLTDDGVAQYHHPSRDTVSPQQINNITNNSGGVPILQAINSPRASIVNQSINEQALQAFLEAAVKLVAQARHAGFKDIAEKVEEATPDVKDGKEAGIEKVSKIAKLVGDVAEAGGKGVEALGKLAAIMPDVAIWIVAAYELLKRAH